MPRDDGDFFKDLRNEIGEFQKRRTSYIQAKLAFLVGLLGVGSISISSFPTSPLLYLTTFVVLVFDLYILGEDFGSKRAGLFLQKNIKSPPEERRWERTAFANRNPVGGIASLLSSLFVIIAAGISLFILKQNGTLYWIWVSLSISVIIATWTYSRILLSRLNKLRKFLDLEFKSEQSTK